MITSVAVAINGLAIVAISLAGISLKQDTNAIEHRLTTLEQSLDELKISLEALNG